MLVFYILALSASLLPECVGFLWCMDGSARLA